MGRRRRQGNAKSQKTNNNSTEGLVKSEGNDSLVAHPNRMIRKSNLSSKKNLKRSFKRSLKRHTKITQRISREHRFKKKKTEEDTETTKGTERELQQTPK
jgi:hypothetical protein